jgi:hypothetical protein
MGAGISEGAPRGTHKPGGRAQGVGAPCRLVAHWCSPLMHTQCQKFLNIPEKIILNFQGILRTFIFRSFFYCTDKTENRRIIAFLLYLI